MPNGNIVEPYYVLEYPNWVDVIPVTGNNEIIMIRQYRHGINKVSLELPCGAIESHETPLEAAKRELLEETGYTCKKFVEMCKLSPNPANHSNYIYSYLAMDVKLTNNQNLDYSEDIDFVAIPIHEVKRMLKNNEIIQAMHVSALFYVFNYLDNHKRLNEYPKANW